MRGVWMVALAAGLIGAGPALAAQQQKLPSPLPAEIVAAWEKAGAQAGWMGDKVADPVFRFRRDGKEGEVPAFQFTVWQPGVLGRLPLPERGFGLSLLSISGLTDGGLKELAGLKSLQSLDPPWSFALATSPSATASKSCLAG